ncbi:ABC transporter ATP-binding protein [Radiobacillus kanasensis]|uniref:ABC transporter ATP-binding protein n=1 Tax=Radiobacillus kanasensis TaxID=2844358 RepID=UPI001E374896|nr:ABC transporter ATP-binding protein [Radiobacillus kanasensis]UFT99806.1 ABC transporter ATP-binding protein [Radiobacillus kanasensis]
MAVLEMQNVSVQIRDTPILKDIDFSTGNGSVTALIGHNGAGKSTIMKTIIGWQEKQKGMILINGQSQEEHFLEFKKQYSYLPEEPLLLSELTVYQHFQLYAKSYQMKKDIFEERVSTYIEDFEIKDKMDEYPEALSKGMRQKVQTICALLPDTPLLLIDEPFMGLDHYAMEYLQGVMKRKAQEGTSILLTTHQLEKVQEIADHFVMLKHGSIIDQGPIENFQELARRNES